MDGLSKPIFNAQKSGENRVKDSVIRGEMMVVRQIDLAHTGFKKHLCGSLSLIVFAARLSNIA